MAYILSLKLRDTRRRFDTETQRDTAYDLVLERLVNLGIPEENIILEKIDTQYSDFLGDEIEKLIHRSRE